MLAPKYSVIPAKAGVSRIAQQFAKDPRLRGGDRISKAAVMDR